MWQKIKDYFDYSNPKWLKHNVYVSCSCALLSFFVHGAITTFPWLVCAYYEGREYKRLSS